MRQGRCGAAAIVDVAFQFRDRSAYCVEPVCPRDLACHPRCGSGDNFEAQRRDTIAEILQCEIFEHDIGAATKGRAVCAQFGDQ